MATTHADKSVREAEVRAIAFGRLVEFLQIVG